MSLGRSPNKPEKPAAASKPEAPATKHGAGAEGLQYADGKRVFGVRVAILRSSFRIRVPKLYIRDNNSPLPWGVLFSEQKKGGEARGN